MRGAFIAGVAGAAIVGIAVGVLLHNRFDTRAVASPPAVPSLHGEATWAAGARPAPDFALRDQTGRRVSLRGLRGRSIALMFMDSICKEACPLEGRAIANAVAQTPAGLRPHIVVVSVDPAGDTPRTIAHALRKWRLPASTLWLLGSHAALARVWRAYQITVDQTSGDVVHSTAVYVLDRSGNERAGFLMPFIPAFVADDFRTLGREAA